MLVSGTLIHCPCSAITATTTMKRKNKSRKEQQIKKLIWRVGAQTSLALLPPRFMPGTWCGGCLSLVAHHQHSKCLHRPRHLLISPSTNCTLHHIISHSCLIIQGCPVLLHITSCVLHTLHYRLPLTITYLLCTGNTRRRFFRILHIPHNRNYYLPVWGTVLT